MTKPGPKPISKEELKAAFDRTVEQLGKVPTKAEMSEHGEYTFRPYQKRFGSWNEAIKACGYEPNVRKSIPKSEVVEDYQRVADELGKTPSQIEYNEHGQFSMAVIRDKFDGMKGVQEAAGLEKLKNGRVKKECETCGGEFSTKHALKDVRRFCSRKCEHQWKAEAYKGISNPFDFHPLFIECEYCGQDFRIAEYQREIARFCSRECMDQSRHLWYSGENHPRWNGGKDGYRGPNWQVQRQLALKRDNYECQHCGSTAEEATMHVHHVIPYASFDSYQDANKLHNLITLCQPCHTNAEWGNINIQSRLGCFY